MSRPKVTLYVDVISPFGYIAYHILRTSPAFQQCDITYIPILLGGVMAATGNQPPINIKNKDKWITAERQRWQKYFQVPMAAEPPSPFPQPTVQAQRALCAVKAQHPDKLTAALDALFKAFWVERQTIGKPEVIAAALETALGKEVATSVIKASSGEAAKKALRESTDGAVADGCFGLPWFVATNAKGETEGFWGVDHVGQLLDFLGLERKGANGFRAVL